MKLALQDPAEYAEVCEGKMETVDGCLDYAFASRDPFNIPELARLLSDLEEYHQKKLQKETQKKLEKQAAATQEPAPAPASTEAPKPKKIKAWKPRTPRCHQMALRPSTFDVRRIKGPTEIIIMIMDHLPHFRDIKTLMWVFPQWRHMVPQACWRDRFIKELALHEPSQNANALDWLYLYFYADQLLAKSHGWLFWKHVLDSLEKTKVAFLIFDEH